MSKKAKLPSTRQVSKEVFNKENLLELTFFVATYFIIFEICGTFLDRRFKEIQDWLISKGFPRRLVNFTLVVAQLMTLIIGSYYVNNTLKKYSLFLFSLDKKMVFGGASALILTQVFTTQKNLQDMMKNVFII
jgi:hypothetical protein